MKSQVWWAGEFIFGDNTQDIAWDGLGLGYRVHKHTLLVLSRSQNRPFEPMIIFHSPLYGGPALITSFLGILRHLCVTEN